MIVTPNVFPVGVEAARAVAWRPVLKKIVNFLTLTSERMGVVLRRAASSRWVGHSVIFLQSELVRLWCGIGGNVDIPVQLSDFGRDGEVFVFAEILLCIATVRIVPAVY